jgi:hypothetical protein
MKFKINDYVKVIDGFIPEEIGEPVSWYGKITELPTSPGDSYCMAFDAQTLDALPDEYLKSAIEGGYDEFSYYLEEEDIEPAPRRDNDALLQAAIKNIERRSDELDEDEDGGYNEPELNQALLDEWLDAFRQSPEFGQIPDDRKDLAADAPETFARFAFDYELRDIGKWTTADVRMVCLDLVPRKVTAEADFFEHFGAGLAAFFAFLDRERLMKGAGTLAATAAKIAPEIPKLAASPRNWGMAKSFMMGASASGYDPTNKEDLDSYMSAYSAGALANLAQGLPPQADPFRNYNGSSLVKVKYPDGNVVKCKFSKVEADLQAGRCAIVKKK